MLSFALAPGSQAQESAPASQARPAETPLADGRQVFEKRCAGCHGLDGRGGERAPDIATRAAVQQRTDANLTLIIKDGIPGRGMPAFSTLDESTQRSLVSYLRVLQGKGAAAKLPGDARRGAGIFFGKGKCSDCHLVNGKGGFVGSDLSGFAQGRSVQEIRQAILKPSENRRQDSAVLVTTRDGAKFTGVVRNEDNFSLQLQTLDGAFHLFLKSEIESAARQPGSLMPSDYGSRLDSQELNDLIAFLMTAAKSDESAGSKKEFREDEENE